MMALDRGGRTIDRDGHLHVPTSILSAAAVNAYAGGEVPDYQALGLDPNRTYWLLRSPDELARAAPSFANKPLLSAHRPTTAADHAGDLVVGSISNPVWDPPNLRGELVIWDAAAIAAVQDGTQRALSCAYRYRAEMKPGIWNGIRFQGIMRDLAGNHCALVPAGRVDGAMVGDAMPKAGVNPLSSTVSNVVDPDSDDDVITQIMKFLSGKLSDDDLSTVGQMLQPSVAMDQTMRTRSARARLAADAAGRASFEKMFPHMNRLQRGL